MRFLWDNILYFLAALGLAAAVYFFLSERSGPVSPPPPAAAPGRFAQGGFTARAALTAEAAKLSAYKNKIAKRLESGFSEGSFTARDAQAAARLCLAVKPLLAQLRGGAPAGRISQLDAAGAECGALARETAKLKSLIKSSGLSSPGATRQLAAVEESLYRLQLHLEALAAPKTEK